MHRKRINVSTVLARQRLGTKEVDEGIWILSFMSYDLGFIDLERKTFQPLDNPSGPRLSPMSQVHCHPSVRAGQMASMVPVEGLEPPTHGLQNRCSTS